MESGAEDQERILETSLVQNWWFIKALDRTRGQKELLPQGCEGWLIIYHGVGGGEEKGGLRKHFHMSKDTGGLAIVKLRLLTPPEGVNRKIVGSFPGECYFPPITCPYQWAAGLKEIPFYLHFLLPQPPSILWRGLVVLGLQETEFWASGS